jgi:uncharacterized membrane protein YphA (DoxX/SURF4 family)
MLRETLPLIAALALGTTFVVSGASKLQDAQGFVLGVLDYQILPSRLAILYARSLPFAEVFIGLLLLFGIWRSIAGIGALALLLSFLIAVVINLGRGRRLKCHCFGSAQTERLGWLTVARILALMMLAIVVSRATENKFFAPGPLIIVPVLLIAFGIFICLYLVTTLPTVWHIWHVRLDKPMTTSSRVSLRELPLHPDASQPSLADQKWGREDE